MFLWLPIIFFVVTVILDFKFPFNIHFTRTMIWPKIHSSDFRHFSNPSLSSNFLAPFTFTNAFSVFVLYLFSRHLFLALIPFSCSSHRFHLNTLHFLPNLYFLLLSQRKNSKNEKTYLLNYFFRLFTGLLFKFNIFPSSSTPQTYWDLLFSLSLNKQNNADFSMMIWHKKVTILSTRWLLPLMLPASTINSGFSV